MGPASSSHRSLPAIHRLRPDIFYGWYIVAACFVLNAISVGIGFYGQTLFLDGLIQENGWSKASVAGASTLYFVSTGLFGLQVGRVVDRFGPRGPLFLGALTTAVALYWLGTIENPSELYAVYLLLAMGFAMSATIPLSALITQWFANDRARAMSWSQTGVSVGGLVLLPLATALIAREGMHVATRWLALFVLIPIFSLTYFVIRANPRDHGLLPDGEIETNPVEVATPSDANWTAREALRSRSFILLALSFAAILVCQTGMAVHHLHFLRVHLDATAAGLGAASLPLGSIVGRLVSGFLADRIDKRWVAAGLFVAQALALAGLGLSTHAPALLVASVAFGLTVGAIFMMQSLLVAELFGLSSFGTVFSLLNFLTSLGGGIGPLLVGVLAEEFGDYQSATPLLCVIALGAAVTMLLVRPPASPEQQADPSPNPARTEPAERLPRDRGRASGAARRNFRDVRRNQPHSRIGRP